MVVADSIDVYSLQNQFSDRSMIYPPKQTQVVVAHYLYVRDHVPIAIKDTAEGGPLEAQVTVVRMHIWSNHSPTKDLPPRQIRVQIDIGREDEVLVVVVGRLAEGDQIGGRGDLVRVVGLARAAAVLGRGGRGR